jgi:hypothetical protein
MPLHGEGSAERAAAPSPAARGGLATVKPPFLLVPGEPTLKWATWLQLFNDTLAASDLLGVSPERKLALLRASLGAEGYRICAELCPAEERLDFDQTVTRLERRFAPAPSRVFSRAKFNSRTQQPGEDSAEFVTALRSLAARCSYPSATLDELLLDRFVAGCSNARVRERLLVEPDDLVLDTALKIAQSLERAVAECSTVSNPDAGADSVSAVDRRDRAAGKDRSSRGGKGGASAGRDRRRCGNCGYDVHDRDGYCPASSRSCRECGKKGHFASCCRSKRRVDEAGDTNVVVFG